MNWNWQQPDWPHFQWDSSRLTAAEQDFLVGAGVFLGKAEDLEPGGEALITVEALSLEALTTSEIEGEILDRDSVQSSVRRELGLSADRRSTPAESGIAELMVDLYRNHDRPLTHAVLKEWHAMLCQGRRDLHEIGSYRTHEEPMQVVSGKLHEPKVHFEAPPSQQVRGEMDRFLEWFASTGPQGSSPLPALTRSGIAHLYFESIHPFEDGNGRLGRAVAELALAQGLGRPYLTALSTTILKERQAYYAMLELSNKANEITEWLAWIAGITLEAQDRTQSQLEFVLVKAKLYRRLEGQLNPRQAKVLERMFREGVDGFRGGLSAGNYMSISPTSPATAGRDLAALVEMGALIAEGERKSRRYYLAIPHKKTERIRIDGDGRVIRG